MSRPTSRLIRAARRHAAQHRFDHLTLEAPAGASDDTPDERVPALEAALARMEDDAHRAGLGA
ncbi:hypothetical protein FZ983_32295 [Azospirillum sp. B21]|uniref:hypothetical protein n=1 Tax=Azospirillum sp. B21 TaxID=2607496 RepID=UPI0011EEDD97|nr:hypothetical protein [Azospirillum sp. B21]KAA0572253.1 hypothetical protein FZ983_32295 [Azospirillum sp. B21]